MKAITVRQPWAWAIANGGKTVENRSRGTTYRGPLAIHAGKGWSDRGAADDRVLALWRELHLPSLPADRHQAIHFPTGSVIAVAHLVDSHPDAGCCRPWGESSYQEAGGRTVGTVHHLVLENVLPLREPLDCRGALGLWTVPDSVVAGSRLLTRYDACTSSKEIQ